MNLFGKKKEAPKADPAQAIINIRMQLETLDKREAHIMTKIEQSKREAVLKAQKNDKNGALFCLKRKKMYEAEVHKLQGAKITLESQALALESATGNIEVLKAMKEGANAMSRVRGNIDASTVDDIMDEINEEKDIAQQISEAISRPAEDMFEDEELMNELQELEELSSLEAESKPAAVAAAPAAAPVSVFSLPAMPAAPNTAPMPAAPTSRVQIAQPQESEEERMLRELQASMI